MHESGFQSNDVCVPIVHRCCIVSTLIFSSIAYASCSSTPYVIPPSACVSGGLFNIRQKVHQKFPKRDYDVSPNSFPLPSPC